jgi:serine/threonine protein kinase
VHCQFCGAALESLPVSCPFCGSQAVLGDRYEIRAIIGRGGMGEVFLAHDRKLDTDVAIKRLSPQFASSPELRESIQREAQIMARLSDASIVRLFDLAEFFGDSYLVLEYVPGPTLRDMIKHGYRPSPQELAKIMGEICQGLTTAHDAGVIHRDLKPSNVLVALHGGEQVSYAATHQLPPNLANAKLKITDFGIAKAIADAHLTVTNAFSGTPGYMAPEQFRGEIPWPQTDVYALGVITHELLTGKLPSQPLQVIEGVHPAVSEVVRKALSPSMQSRFPSAAKFYEALYNGIEGHSPFPRVVVPARPGITSSQRIGLVVAITFAIAMVAIILAIQTSSPAPRVNATVPNISIPTPSKPVELHLPVRPPPFDWHPFPKSSELPPVVEEARGKLAPASLLGPQNPKIKWDIAVPEMLGASIAMVGKDGTVYLVGSQGELCAIRDGKLQWAYKTSDFPPFIEDIDMDRDGRLWFKIHTMGGYERYCFNRDGKGGRLPRSFEDQGPVPQSSRNDFSCWKNKHTLSGPQGDLDLDDDCLSVAVGPEKRIYVATDAPQILAVSKQGHIEFKYNAPCSAESLIPTLANQLIYLCKDQTMHALRGASEIWKRSTDAEIRSVKTDAAGTVYYGDAKPSGEKGRLHAIDDQGKDLWVVELPRTAKGSITFGGDRQIYVFQPNYILDSSHLIYLSD